MICLQYLLLMVICVKKKNCKSHHISVMYVRKLVKEYITYAD